MFLGAHRAYVRRDKLSRLEEGRGGLKGNRELATSPGVFSTTALKSAATLEKITHPLEAGYHATSRYTNSPRVSLTPSEAVYDEMAAAFDAYDREIATANDGLGYAETAIGDGELYQTASMVEGAYDESAYSYGANAPGQYAYDDSLTAPYTNDDRNSAELYAYDDRTMSATNYRETMNTEDYHAMTIHQEDMELARANGAFAQYGNAHGGSF